MRPPLLIITIVGALYAHYGDLAMIGRILARLAAAAAGLLIAMAAKMAEPAFALAQVSPGPPALLRS